MSVHQEINPGDEYIIIKKERIKKVKKRFKKDIDEVLLSAVSQPSFDEYEKVLDWRKFDERYKEESD